MLDTKGLEYRIGTFAQGHVTLRERDDFTFTPGMWPGMSISVRHLQGHDR
jgi:pyruvate kinase